MDSGVKERIKYNGYLLITAILWSSGGVLIKLVNWNSAAIAGSRSLFAAIFILFIIKKPTTNFNKVKIGGSLSYAGTLTFFVIATKITFSANAIILQYTAPIYILIYGTIFLKEKISLTDIVCMFVIFTGIIMFFIDDLSYGNSIGNFFGVLSGITFASMIIFMQKDKDNEQVNTVFWGNIIAFIITLPFMFGEIPDLKSILGLIILGFFQIGLPYVIYTKAVNKVSALDAVLIPILEPVLNPVWVFLVLGERPGHFAIIGGIIVLIAVSFRSLAPLFIKTTKLSSATK
ncbi:DMT family transporter [Clostridium sp. DL1XJH146]